MHAVRATISTGSSASQPADHVEVVDHRVIEDPVRHRRDIIGRRDFRIAADSTSISGRPISPERIASCNARCDGSKRRLNPTKNGTPRRSSTSPQRSTRAEIEVDRLFAEDRLAGVRRRSMIAACVRGGVQMITARVPDRRAPRRGPRSRARHACVRALRRPARSRSTTQRKLRARMRGDVRGMDGSDEPGADETKLDHAAPLARTRRISLQTTLKPAPRAALRRLVKPIRA